MPKEDKIKRSEWIEQSKVFSYAKFIPELRWMFAIPNGGYRNMLEAVNLKRQGVKAGISDIFLPVSRGGFHGLFIEMKVGKNKPTILQQCFLDFVNKEGYSGKLCYGASEAINEIKKYMRLPK